MVQCEMRTAGSVARWRLRMRSLLVLSVLGLAVACTGEPADTSGTGGIDPVPTVDPNDPDGDGLTNEEEAKLGTDPDLADTDTTA